MDGAAPASAAPTRSRGRPRNPPTETPQQRVARLQAELEAAETALRAETEKQAAIIGQAVIAALRDDPGFRAAILPKLRSLVTRKEDRAAIASLLAEP